MPCSPHSMQYSAMLDRCSRHTSADHPHLAPGIATYIASYIAHVSLLHRNISQKSVELGLRRLTGTPVVLAPNMPNLDLTSRRSKVIGCTHGLRGHTRSSAMRCVCTGVVITARPSSLRCSALELLLSWEVGTRTLIGMIARQLTFLFQMADIR